MESGELEVGEYLGCVNRLESLNALHFDQHRAVDDDVGSIRISNGDSTKLQSNGDFRFDVRT